MDALIDICVPVWNCNPAYFKQAIDSALAQTETRWRMYIHDDASTSDMEAMVKPYLSDPRISWHPNRTKLGIGGNWNATMKLGSAPFVQFLFPDDWWEPTFLEKGLQAMEQNPSVGIVSLGHTYVGEGAVDIRDQKDVELFWKEYLRAGRNNGMDILRWWIQQGLYPNIIGEPDFVMLRRSVTQKAGWYLEDMRQNLDVEYGVRCLMLSDWYYISDCLGYFRIHKDAATSINLREGKGVFDRFRCLEILIDTLPSEDKALAIEARKNALTSMARNYLKRLKKKRKISPAGGGTFKKFAMRHPLLVAKALWRAWRGK